MKEDFTKIKSINKKKKPNMSYDLMVFNLNTAPQSETEFLKWYDEQTEWNEDHSYVDPIVTSPELKNWFLEMTQIFPAMNGPYALDDDNEVYNEYITDYIIGKNSVYTSFRWTVAEKAYPKMLELAKKHKVGFFDVSGSCDIIIPCENGVYESLQRRNDSKAWWKIWKKAL
jgi:hypothetical protein